MCPRSLVRPLYSGATGGPAHSKQVTRQHAHTHPSTHASAHELTLTDTPPTKSASPNVRENNALQAPSLPGRTRTSRGIQHYGSRGKREKSGARLSTYACRPWEGGEGRPTGSVCSSAGARQNAGNLHGSIYVHSARHGARQGQLVCAHKCTRAPHRPPPTGRTAGWRCPLAPALGRGGTQCSLGFW